MKQTCARFADVLRFLQPISKGDNLIVMNINRTNKCTEPYAKFENIVVPLQSLTLETNGAVRSFSAFVTAQAGSAIAAITCTAYRISAET